jgi:ABC transporter
MGVYNQHFVDRLPMTKTPVEFLRDSFPDEDYQSIRNRLGKYGLEGHAHEVTMRDLSGGQKARVVFVDLSLQKPHLLLLDEPTVSTITISRLGVRAFWLFLTVFLIYSPAVYRTISTLKRSTLFAMPLMHSMVVSWL